MFLHIPELQRVKATAVCKFSFHAPLPGLAVLCLLLRDLPLTLRAGLAAPGVIKHCQTQQKITAQMQDSH